MCTPRYNDFAAHFVMKCTFLVWCFSDENERLKSTRSDCRYVWKIQTTCFQISGDRIILIDYLTPNYGTLKLIICAARISTCVNSNPYRPKQNLYSCSLLICYFLLFASFPYVNYSHILRMYLVFCSLTLFIVFILFPS